MSAMEMTTEQMAEMVRLARGLEPIWEEIKHRELEMEMREGVLDLASDLFPCRFNRRLAGEVVWKFSVPLG